MVLILHCIVTQRHIQIHFVWNGKRETKSYYTISTKWFVFLLIAVQRVRDYIRYVDGKIPTKPAMATTLDDDFEILRWTVPSIVEALKESQKLSENIYLAEIEVQNIDKLLELFNQCKRDNENYMKQLSVRIIKALV